MFTGKAAEQSLLFPMNKVFESYVGKMLAVKKWTVNLQNRNIISQFVLRLGILLQNKHEQCKIIIDKKNSLMELVEYYGK